MTNRRDFFKNGSLLGLGGLLFNPLEVFSAPTSENIFKNKKNLENAIKLWNNDEKKTILKLL